MYTWKEVLPTKGLQCGGLLCARKLKLAISMLSESEFYNRFIVSISCINSSV